MLWMVAASFMPAGEANAYPPRLLPSAPTLEHYATLFTRLDLGRNLVNSAVVAAAVTVLSLLHQFAWQDTHFAKLRFRDRDRLFRLLSAGLLLPVQVSMLPLFLLFKELGLINSYWGVIMPSPGEHLRHLPDPPVHARDARRPARRSADRRRERARGSTGRSCCR